MKSHLEHLLDLKTNNKYSEIRDTWVAFGSLSVTGKTKAYVKDTLFQVVLPGYSDPAIVPSDLHMALVYCTADYKVDNAIFPLINWETVSVSEIEGKCSVVSGITSPHFRVILNYSNFTSIVTPVNEDFMPYQIVALDSDIIIDDDELEIILGEVGVPFLNVAELEYTREKILNTCIKPALQEYYKFFPISEQVELGQVGCNSEYLFELPKFCYAVTRAWVAQASGGNGGMIGKGAYNFMMQTGGGSGLSGSSGGRGVNYRGKNVPGFTGGGDHMSAYLLQRAANQSLINYSKREKFKYIRKDKKISISGFSTLGGILCVNYAKWSPDWDSIQFDRLNEVRNLCTSYILQNLGMLRALVKSDVPGTLDYTLYTNRAEKLSEKTLKFWASLPTNFATVIRG